MKAIILAAGRGKRMEHLSADTPKPMLKVLGKTLLHHKLDLMPDEIDEVVIVVGYMKDKIIEGIGNEYNGKKITYVVDDEAANGVFKGTAHAVNLCKNVFSNNDRFVVMMGDDIYCKEDIEKCIAHDFALLIREVDSIQGKAKVVFDEHGHVLDILEKYPHDERAHVNVGMYSLTSEIFNHEIVSIGGGEYGLPQTILAAAKTGNIKVNVVPSDFLLQITSPEDIADAEKFFSENEKI